MTGKEFRYVQDTIENEGFDYSFTGYSAFDDIIDDEFHKLRLAYLLAREKLANYIGTSE